MNQKLLNINTVINPSINLDSIISQQLLDINYLNNKSNLQHITYIINNNTSTLKKYFVDKNNNKNEQLKYKIIKYLGKGIHGNLYLALDLQGQRIICKEIILDSSLSKKKIQLKQLVFELNILKYLSNNIVTKEHINPCIDYKIYKDYIYTIFPVFKGYSLGYFYKYMLKLQIQDDYYKITFLLIKSLLHALSKIHDVGIAHQNITPNSILVSTFIKPDEIKVKFTDFGLSCSCPKNIDDSNQTKNSTDINNTKLYNTIIPWQQNELFRKINNCKINSHIPDKFIKDILEQLKDSDYLKISQKYDILCIGLIIIKFLLYFDTNINNIIDILIDKFDYNKMQLLRDLIQNNFIVNNSLKDYTYISNQNKKIILEYLKFILKYMITSSIKRKSAQYIIDKIIIYEKYKNDIF